MGAAMTGPMQERGPCGCNGSRGFTVTELLVTLAVIAIILSLILPAVMSARESARRTQCLSSIRQLGLALHGYHDVHRMFPPAHHAMGFSHFASLLPYMEQAALVAKIDFNVEPRSGVNVAVAEVSLPLLQCPSDPASSAVSKYGKTNYVGNAGTGLHTEGEETGVFVIWPHRQPIRPIRFTGITDGLATTAAFSEILVGDSSNHPLRKIWETTTEYFGAENAGRLLDECEAIRGTPGRGDPWSRGSSWMMSEHLMTRYNHSQTPNRLSCTNNGDIYTMVMTVASHHPGGVHVNFCDGSAKMVSDSIDLEIWRALASRAGNELVGEF